MSCELSDNDIWSDNYELSNNKKWELVVLKDLTNTCKFIGDFDLFTEKCSSAKHCCEYIIGITTRNKC